MARNDAEHRLSGRVTHVSDGDTLWFRTTDGQRHKVRLEGIDAPELCQAWGAQSRAALQGRAERQPVQVQGQRRDDYGRLLGRVTVAGEDLGAWMVQNGHAWSYRFRWNQGPYASQEREALAAGRGLFASPRPQQPREFRRSHGPCSLPAPALAQ